MYEYYAHLLMNEKMLSGRKSILYDNRISVVKFHIKSSAFSQKKKKRTDSTIKTMQFLATLFFMEVLLYMKKRMEKKMHRLDTQKHTHIHIHVNVGLNICYHSSFLLFFFYRFYFIIAKHKLGKRCHLLIGFVTVIAIKIKTKEQTFSIQSQIN